GKERSFQGDKKPDCDRFRHNQVIQPR
ncbi:MAG: hypothetical protein DVB22_000996, partial [Verrucomicrobia bacterium]